MVGDAFRVGRQPRKLYIGAVLLDRFCRCMASRPEKLVDAFVKGSLGFFGVLAMVLLFPLLMRHLLRRIVGGLLKKIVLTVTMGFVSGKVVELLLRRR